jgi:hypothetical protein
LKDALLPRVASDCALCRHPKELVRKKVVMVLHRFFQLDASAVTHLGDAMRRTLCDKELVPSFVSILKQIVEHRLPRDFDYHRIPAPWNQLRLLRILALLGRADQAASEGMYEVLADVMRRADTGINIGYAIVYECVRTITSIYPNSTLLDEARLCAEPRRFGPITKRARRPPSRSRASSRRTTTTSSTSASRAWRRCVSSARDCRAAGRTARR